MSTISNTYSQKLFAQLYVKSYQDILKTELGINLLSGRRRTSVRTLENWIESFMHITRNTEAAYLFRKWTALSTVASALQRKCYLIWGTLTFYPNMYVVLTAPSGKRKASSMDISRDWFLNEINVSIAAEAITREALIRELRTSTSTEVDMDTGMMEFHSSMTIHSQELTVFLGYQNHQLMADLCDWFDCRNRWTYRTKSQGVDEIIGVWVNLIGATTPTLIQSTMPQDAIGGGLTSRMIFVYERKKGKTVILPSLDANDLILKDQMLTDLKRIKTMTGRFTTTDDFIELWANWYPAQDNNPPFKDERFEGYFERRPTHVMKMACILNAARTESMIVTAKDLQDAIDLLEQTEVNMRHTFSGLGQARHAALLSKVMVEIGNAKQVNFSDLMFSHRADADPRMLEDVINILQSGRFCTYVRNTGLIELNKDWTGDVSFLCDYIDGQD